MEKQHLLCRVGYCENCRKKGYPRANQKFLTYGSHGYHVDFANLYQKQSGFTPHIYKLTSIEGTTVHCKRVCCMDKCAIQIVQADKPGQYNFFILDTAWQETQMPISDWNALKRFKRDPSYII